MCITSVKSGKMYTEWKSLFHQIFFKYYIIHISIFKQFSHQIHWLSMKCSS